MPVSRLALRIVIIAQSRRASVKKIRLDLYRRRQIWNEWYIAASETGSKNLSFLIAGASLFILRHVPHIPVPVLSLPSSSSWHVTSEERTAEAPLDSRPLFRHKRD